MAKGYYMEGYYPPEGVDSASKVKEWQRKLGVKADGIWGPDTQAAFRAQQQQSTGTPFYWGWGDPDAGTGTAAQPQPSAPASGGYGGNSFQSYYDAILRNLETPSISIDLPSEKEVTDIWKGILRPEVDSAIERRREDADRNMAELDADAVSRGMGSSSYVTGMKAREQEDAGEDIEDMEAQYSSILAERIFDTLNQYRQLSLDAQKFNASARASAGSLAANLASDWYSQYLARESAERTAALERSYQGSSSKGSSGSSGSSGSGSSAGSSKKQASASPRMTVDDYIEYVGNLSASQRRQLFNSESEYWRLRREELLSALGSTVYNAIRRNMGG